MNVQPSSASRPTKTTVLKHLRKVRSLLAKPTNWRQGSFYGGTTKPERAKCFCLDGAIRKAISGSPVTVASMDDPIANAVRAAILGRKRVTRWLSAAIYRFNDRKGRTHEQVVAKISDAIRRVSSSNTGGQS